MTAIDDQPHPHRRRPDARLARDRLRARHRDGGGARRGAVADAFLVAFRLPNHFRAIFAEGAFAAAFVPAYARIREQGGVDAAKLFADRIFTLLLASQVVLLALALLFTPAVICCWRGFGNDPTRFRACGHAHAHHVSVSVADGAGDAVSGILNSIGRFAAAAAAPILLNLTMVATLLARGVLPDARSRGGVGRADRGRAGSAARRRRCATADVMTTLRRPVAGRRGEALLQGARTGDRRLGGRAARAVRRHHHRELPRGRRAFGALYADRLYQLPGGVIGIAAALFCCPRWRVASRPAMRRRARRAGARDQFTLLLAILASPRSRRARPDHACTVPARQVHRRRRQAAAATLAAYTPG